MTIDLIPCAHCGATDSSIEEEAVDCYGSTAVVCGNIDCQAIGPIVKGHDRDPAVAAEAARLWNMRAQIAQSACPLVRTPAARFAPGDIVAWWRDVQNVPAIGMVESWVGEELRVREAGLSASAMYPAVFDEHDRPRVIGRIVDGVPVWRADEADDAIGKWATEFVGIEGRVLALEKELAELREVGNAFIGETQRFVDGVDELNEALDDRRTHGPVSVDTKARADERAAIVAILESGEPNTRAERALETLVALLEAGQLSAEIAVPLGEWCAAAADELHDLVEVIRARGQG